MRVLLQIFLFLLVVITGRCANADNYYFRHYTNKDGLSHNTVYCSLQDTKGFMWFGTDDGLNRFDGYSFRVYRYNSRPHTEKQLLHNRIISLFEDSSGKIWVCTTGGVCYYDYETNVFYPFIPDNQSSYPHYAEQIAEDCFGNLWFRNHLSITRYNMKSGNFKVFSSEQYGFRSVAFTMTEKGIPVIADGLSLLIFDPENETFSRLTSLSYDGKNELTVIQTILELPQVGYFIGTDLDGLLLYRTETGHTETVIPDIHVRAIIPYNDNIYWIASESGVYIYSLLDKSVVNLRKSLTNDYTIADNAVYSLTKDREGGVWVGSFFGGINYLPKNHRHFTYFIGGKTHPGMLGNSVREICADKYGHLWLGTEDNGINCYNPTTGTMINFSLLNAERTLAATNVHGLFPDGDTLWVGTFNKGIELLHIPTGKVLQQFTQTNTGGDLISNFVLCFYKTSGGDFLIGTSSGSAIFDKQSSQFMRWEGIDGLVRQFLEDRDGNIWVSTDNGLYRYVAGISETGLLTPGGHIHRYHAGLSSDVQGLGSSNITSIFEDSKGRIWVTTVSGFSLYEKETDSFDRITAADGLPSNIVYRIVEDDDHDFWISTANGLVRFDPETRVIHTYTYSDGLHETQFNFCSSYKSTDGTIYMGTINGMISFQPKSFVSDTYVPPLYITCIQVADNPQKNTDLIINDPDKPYLLTLPYNSATFTVSYIAPGFTSPDAVKYAYILEGSDHEWVYMDKHKDVTFANLSPGKYTFKVRSTNSSDIWQSNEQLMEIIITPPFWATIGAFICYGLLLVVAAVLFYRYKKLSFFRKAEHQRELFEAEKEKELYDAKIQFFTFITHEIRTPLTLIKAPLDKIFRSGNLPEDTCQHLRVIEKHTQRLLELSNQLLDFRKTEISGFRLNFVKTDVSVMLEQIIAPYLPLLQQEGKELLTELPDKPFFAYIDRNAFLKLISNLLTNAQKYASTFIRIHMDVPDGLENLFTIWFINDGFLIPDSESDNIFIPFYRLKETAHEQGSGIGLSLSRTLAELHHGSLVYRATETGLNRFILTLPIRQGIYGFDLTDVNDPSKPTDIIDAETDPDRPVILVVEDQPDLRRFIAGELALNYRVLEAENGKLAMDLLASTIVHLIISDIMMPVTNGFELCNNVKNDVRFSHIPILLLTAQHNLQSRLKGLNRGADAYMVKPFSLEHLTAQVENLLKNRDLLRKAYLEKPSVPSQSLSVTPVDDDFIKKITVYIEENLTNEHLSVESIAVEMHLSNSSLYRKVKGLCGLSPVDFIRIARLKKAVDLMQSGEKRINEIAFAVGFSTPAYFSTTFHKQYGKSPSEFMKTLI